MRPVAVFRFSLVLLLAADAWAASNFDGVAWCDGPVRIVVDTSGVGSNGDAASVLAQGVADAASRWNRALRLPLFEISFLPPTEPERLGDGVSSIRFSTTISPTRGFAGQFGFTDTLRARKGRLVESDLILNPAWDWFSYRGPLRYDTDGNRVPDVYRVTLHELGHLLGLGHPASDATWTVMRSRMSDVDDLTPSDLRDAVRIKDRLLEKNAPRVAGVHSVSTSARSWKVRGTGRPFFVRKAAIKLTSAGGTRRVALRIGAVWSRHVRLEPGVNWLRFYRRSAEGEPVLFAVRRIDAR